MALFGRDYDRDYGRMGGAHRGRPGNWGMMYDRDYGPGARGMYDRQFGHRAQNIYDRDYSVRRPQHIYDHDYGAAGAYDREHRRKSRWQTDYGDPFGDRISHTPIRMIEGEFHREGREYGGSEAGYWGTPSGYSRYDENYGNRAGWRQRGWEHQPPGAGGWQRGQLGWRGREPMTDRYDAGWY